ncbi:MAG: hypothetical protein KKE37_11175 [Verrucomicrobia bacterium]|nr:hypothetical protein [Verrucomicrobiota bacterium]MBU4291018.1 hypothetical protein [Verrucomicrobiota bacterium]MBU4429899.1 hypothetical protein [Verrucomicrobiota bacterium]MCG2678908.1 hypothetical protein [Kiritimatiellia bacterium]
MDRLLMMAVPFAVGVGVIAGLVAWIAFRKRVSSAIICLLAALLCVAYYAVAIILLGVPLGFLFHRLLFLTIIVPWGYGFGQGENAFLIAAAIQTGFSSVVAVVVVTVAAMRQRRKNNANNTSEGIRQPADGLPKSSM